MDDKNINDNEINEGNLQDELVNRNNLEDYKPQVEEVIETAAEPKNTPIVDATKEPILEFPPSSDVFTPQENTAPQHRAEESNHFDEVPEYQPPEQPEGYNYPQHYANQPNEAPQNSYQNRYFPPQGQGPNYTGPPQNQGGYPPHMQGSPYPQRQSRNFSIVSLVLSIGSIVLMVPLTGFVGIVMAIVSVILSSVAKKREGRSSMATAAMVIGIIGIVLNALYIVFLILGLVFLSTGMYNNYMYW